MNPTSIDNVIILARKAGERIMHYRGKVDPTMKGDGSPVTIADKEASDIIVNGLRKLTPDIPVVSEEAPEAENFKALQSARYWITDPLDGTRSFIDGHSGFGVHIALVEDGVPVMGVVYFPAKGDDGILYYTGDDGLAYRQEVYKPPEVIQVNEDYTGRLLKVAVSHKKSVQPQSVRGHFYQAVGGVGGGRLCLAADGQADLAWMVREKEWSYSYWDIAAAHAVLLAAGGDVVDFKRGTPFRYAPDHFGVPDIVAGHENTLRKLNLKQ